MIRFVSRVRPAVLPPPYDRSCYQLIDKSEIALLDSFGSYLSSEKTHHGPVHQPTRYPAVKFGKSFLVKKKNLSNVLSKFFKREIKLRIIYRTKLPSLV